jgi:NADH-quinone oxidoreductase subunit L
MFFLVFHGEERMDEHTREHLHESPWVVTLPLILLAIPSVISGYLIDPIVFGDFFEGAIYVAPENDVIGALGEHYHGPLGFILHGMMTPPFYLAMAGLFTAWFIYMKRPELAAIIRNKLNPLYVILEHKYGFDEFNQKVFAGGSVQLGRFLWRVGDVFLIDKLLVNGAAWIVGFFSGEWRHLQTGYLYHYSFAMIIGLIGLLGWYVVF